MRFPFSWEPLLWPREGLAHYHDTKVDFGGSIVNLSSGRLTTLRCSISDILTADLIGTSVRSSWTG